MTGLKNLFSSRSLKDQLNLTCQISTLPRICFQDRCMIVSGNKWSNVIKIKNETNTLIKMDDLRNLENDCTYAFINITYKNSRKEKIDMEKAYACNFRAILMIERILNVNYQQLKPNFFIGIPLWDNQAILKGRKTVLEHFHKNHSVREFRNTRIKNKHSIIFFVITIINNHQLSTIQEILSAVNKKLIEDLAKYKKQRYSTLKKITTIDQFEDKFIFKFTGLEAKNNKDPIPNVLVQKLSNDLSWIDKYIDFINDAFIKENFKFQCQFGQDDSNRNGSAILFERKSKCLYTNYQSLDYENSECLKNMVEHFRDRKFGYQFMEKFWLINRSDKLRRY